MIGMEWAEEEQGGDGVEQELGRVAVAPLISGSSFSP